MRQPVARWAEEPALQILAGPRCTFPFPSIPTPVRFVLAYPTEIFDSGDGEAEDLDVSHFILCSINLRTGQPEMVIAKYDMPQGAIWSITWGFAH